MPAAVATATNLRVDGAVDPLGLDEVRPRFGWWVADDRPGAHQTAYRVRVATSRDALEADEPDLWDSARVAGSRQLQVEYEGAPLTSRRSAVWDVTVWDADGRAGTPSSPASFEMGLLERDDWLARWIGTPVEEAGLTTAPAPILRRTFGLERAVRSARLYVTALGLYVAHLNGRPVSDDWFRPGWTDYGRRLQYQTYDVTGLVRQGNNALAVMLGDGWYSGRVAWEERGLFYGSSPALLAQLEVVHDDGTVTTIGTDGSWRWAEGPVRRQDLLEGEDYDARREVPRWDDVGCDESGFGPVVLRDRPDAALTAAPAGPVRVVQELLPVDEPRRVDGGGRRIALAFDLGQNFTGVVRLRVRGPRGATIRVRHAEMLDADGSLYTANLRSARATDTYTLRGDPEGETWAPRFTFHGFRHVELSYSHHWRGKLTRFDRHTVTGLALSSALDQTGSFQCSDERLDRLQSNVQWGQRSNFLEVPTDCPQRDERLGWTGDAQVFAPTAAFNMDVERFFAKWARDLDDAQRPDGRVPSVAPNVLNEEDGGPGWSDARVLCAWAVYLAYGDTRILERHYDAMVRWLEWEASTLVDGVRCADGCGYFQGYSDWLALDSSWQSVWSATPRDLIGTAYFARTAGVMAEVAAVLGEEKDAARFSSMRDEAVAGFNGHFVSLSGELTVQTQTAHLMALAWDLLPEEHRPAALDRLLVLLQERDWHLSTGFLGTPLLCPVLSRFGRTDVAYRVLVNDDYPGWLFPVRNGATTMWERWNSWTPEHGFGDVNMNSFNHYAYGAIGRWMYDTIGGVRIDQAAPGYEHVLVRPEPGGGLTRARTSIRSVRGRIESGWEIDGGRFVLRLSLPANVTATVVLPDGATSEVGAGSHELTCAL